MKQVCINLTGKLRSESNLDKEARKYIRILLEETREKFRDCFMELANSDTKKDRRKFLSLYNSLAELCIPKQVLSFETSEEEFQKLLDLVNEEKKEGGASC